MRKEQEKAVVAAEELLEHNTRRRELPGYRLKKAAVTVALDIRLAGIVRSPERCARNLLELGLSTFPNQLTKEEQSILLQKFITVCKNQDKIKARELFFASFLA